MKKLVQIFVLMIFLAACSGLPAINLPQFGVTPTAPAPMTIPTQTPPASETPIPTQNMFVTSTATPLTFTPTVTAIGADLFTPTKTMTVTDFPTITPGVPVGGAAASYFTPQNVGFISVFYSYHVLYWDQGPCLPREIKISAFPEDLIKTDKVLLFMRLRSKKNTLDFTDWGAGAIMNKADNGSFNYTIHTWNLKRFFYYPDAWIEYQLVAFTKAMEEIGRTQVYDKNITLAHCGVIR